jgi:mannosyl-oligosaccharide alpha-1,2-mannosidase
MDIPKRALQPGDVLAKIKASGELPKEGAQPAFQRRGLREDTAWKDKVHDMFMHAWDGYKAHAWGADCLKPVSQGKDNNFLGMGATIVDALDTLLIIGEVEEFNAARDWTLSNLQFDTQENVSLFETTIRILGGLLAAWDLDGRREPRFLDKAKALADKLLTGFESPSGIPYGTVGFASNRKYNPQAWTAGGGSSISEVATLQMEFEGLTAATGDAKYAAAVRRVMRKIRAVEPADSLYPMFISPESGAFTSSMITLGARGDSTYEYLLKQWVQAGGRRGGKIGNGGMVGSDVVEAELTEEERHAVATGSSREDAYFSMIRAMYDRAARGVDKHLVKTCTEGEHLMYIAERSGTTIVDKMDHLVCFAGGMFALGARGETAARDMELAAGVTKTCGVMYDMTPTKLAPEIVRFGGGRDIQVDAGSKHCLLRPEAAEAWFYMYRATGDDKYRQWGRQMIEALETHAKVEGGGYTSLDDVSRVPPGRARDHMESFFLAETLKYLYLLFTDGDVLSLDEWVFNTEAHPMRVFDEVGPVKRPLHAPLPTAFAP